MSSASARPITRRELQLGSLGAVHGGEHAGDLGAVDHRAVPAELLGRAHGARGDAHQHVEPVAVLGVAGHAEGDRHAAASASPNVRCAARRAARPPGRRRARRSRAAAGRTPRRRCARPSRCGASTSCMSRATCWSARSPAAWPRAAFSSPSPSRSPTTTASGRPVRRERSSSESSSSSKARLLSRPVSGSVLLASDETRRQPGDLTALVKDRPRAGPRPRRARRWT